MPGFIYRQVEPNKWEVGHFASGMFSPESAFATGEEAAARVHYLNGGNMPELVEALKSLLQQWDYVGAPKDHPDMIAARNALVRAGDKEAIKERLEYLRGEIEAERISYGEIAELQSLTKHIEPGDTLLLEWAGVPEEGGENERRT